MKNRILNLLMLSILLLGLISCSPRVVEHTLTVTQVPVKVAAPIAPVYEPLDKNEHIGSKKNVMIIWRNFEEAESARKSAYDAYKAYDEQVTETKDNEN